MATGRQSALIILNITLYVPSCACKFVMEERRRGERGRGRIIEGGSGRREGCCVGAGVERRKGRGTGKELLRRGREDRGGGSEGLHVHHMYTCTWLCSEEPKLKEASTTIGYQVVELRPAICVACTCTCDTHTPGHPSTADEAWYWPKHVMHIGWLFNV